MSRDNLIRSLIGKKFPILDKGHIVLIDVMGDDHAICDAARVSYGKGTHSVSDDRTLIRYLMRHHHGTPFEMAEIKLLLRIPNGDTWRQMIRHRSGSIQDEASMWDEPSVNAYSYRYSEAPDLFQETSPSAWRLQSATNRQGSGGFVSADQNGQCLSEQEQHFHQQACRIYQDRLAAGVTREQARKDLPNSLYTDAYWKCDLRNVLHFLSLRMDLHAQLEIRQYANVIGREIVAHLFPLTWEAFEDYVLGAVTLSRLDIVAIQNPTCDLKALYGNKREAEEGRDKLVRLGLINVDSQVNQR